MAEGGTFPCSGSSVNSSSDFVTLEGDVKVEFVSPDANNTLDEMFDFKCEPCSLDMLNSNALFYCSACKSYLCDQCHRAHRQLYRDHEVLDRTHVEEWGNVKTEYIEQCNEHSDKEISLFCQDHECLCCAVCVSVSHRYVVVFILESMILMLMMFMLLLVDLLIIVFLHLYMRHEAELYRRLPSWYDCDCPNNTICIKVVLPYFAILGGARLWFESLMSR